MKLTPVLERSDIESAMGFNRFRQNLPLLHHLQGGTKNGATQIRLLIPKATLKAAVPAREPAGARDHRALVFLVSNDLSQFSLDVLRVARLATKATERTNGIFDAAVLDKVAR